LVGISSVSLVSRSREPILSMARAGLYQTFIAQQQYANKKNMGDLGFPPETERHLAAAASEANKR